MKINASPLPPKIRYDPYSRSRKDSESFTMDATHSTNYREETDDLVKSVEVDNSDDQF